MASERKCCVPSCGKTRENDNILHRFPNPNKDLARFRAWTLAVGGNILALDDMYVYKYRRVCHWHMEPRYWTSSKMLSNIAIPTLHLKEEPTNDKALNNGIDSSSTNEKPANDVDMNNGIDSSSINEKPANDVDMNNGIDSSSINEKPANDVDMNDSIDSSPINDFEEPAKNEEKEVIFSWQKDILYPTDEDTDVLMCPSVRKDEKSKQELGDLSLYDEDLPAVVGWDSDRDKHAEYQCNVCQKEIVGFRYTCVQCADWDLCGACEARAAHTAHYMLRVPSPRPYNEIQAVLAAIRQQLLSENLFLSEQITDDGVKLEPEEEAAIAPPEPAAEPDPLQQRLSDSEDAHTNDSKHSSPRRKRPRLRSSDVDENSEAETFQDDTYDSTSSTPVFNHHLRIYKRKPKKISPDTRLADHPSFTDDPRNKPAPRNESTPVNPIEVSGDTTVNIEEMPRPLDTDPIHTGVEVVGFESNAEGSDQVLLLRVPPDTNDAALAEALHSQPYVVMQPLVIEVQELNCVKR